MRAAIAFLTPFGGASAPSATALSWFPVVGAGQGLVLGLIWWAGDRVFTALVAATLVVVADLVLTGMLHLDGLADSADGLLPPLDRGRRLEVMATPEVGAFGVGAIVSFLLLRVAALAALAPSPLLLAGLWCASRTAMAAAARLMPYARSSGLASAFVDDGGPGWAIASAGGAVSLGLVSIGAVLVDDPVGGSPIVAGVLGVMGVALGAWAVLQLARRRVGGFTGDVLGAAGVVGETIGLVLATVRW
ncbi:MAG: adenosylcobinamide-GDP ribazoletransferase [Actinobacteria bacterium]|nr:adenosylcobinamide-GDP ribazoletransferase [Actinomycetota bacterium]MBI3257742.1 adenosylcobinamide-GDP ribazoletransferase [Actinomycetota bacterium]